MRGLIYAVSPEGVIGKGGSLPWRHPGDSRRFKRVTLGSAVIMGRITFESMGRPLPGRRNLVVTRNPGEVLSRASQGIVLECAPTVKDALARAEDWGDKAVWFIGGARIYQEAMPLADCIDVTYVPDRVEGPELVLAPEIDEALFEAGPLLVHEDEPALVRRVYTRRSPRIPAGPKEGKLPPDVDRQ